MNPLRREAPLLDVGYATTVKTGAYIARQMAYAGAERNVFTEAVIDEFFRFSSGAARLINKVCMHSLIYDRSTNTSSSTIL